MKEQHSREESSPVLCRACTRKIVLLPGVIFFSGCGRAPTFNILGSFFPAWLICMIAGIFLAAAANRLFVYLRIDNKIVWSIVVYPCIAMFFACTFWLIFFS
jgi:hypothetical protein